MESVLTFRYLMKPLRDSIVALVTPFNADLSVDYSTFKQLIEFHLRSGTQGIVVAGTTGEVATLTNEEKLNLLDIAVDTVKTNNSNIPVIFNSGNNNTLDSIKLSQQAESRGADWLTIVTPYYNKPSQNGLYEHYVSIARAVRLPICIYNVPGRTALEISVDTIARLAEIDNILAIKDASSALERPLEIQYKLQGKSFTQLSGEDGTFLGYLAHGGVGCISVVCNIVPKEWQQIHTLWHNANIQQALQEHIRLLPLWKSLFIETNPVPVKYALSLMGKCQPYVRLPLVELNHHNKQTVKQALIELNLIN